MILIDADALIEAINTWPKFGVDERGRIVPWNEGYEPYVHLRDVVVAITGMPTIEPDRSLWFRIGEICVDESKGFISAGKAVEKIREVLREAERQEE